MVCCDQICDRGDIGRREEVDRLASAQDFDGDDFRHALDGGFGLSGAVMLMLPWSFSFEEVGIVSDPSGSARILSSDAQAPEVTWASTRPYRMPPCWVKKRAAFRPTIRRGNDAAHGQFARRTGDRPPHSWHERAQPLPARSRPACVHRRTSRSSVREEPSSRTIRVES